MKYAKMWVVDFSISKMSFLLKSALTSCILLFTSCCDWMGDKYKYPPGVLFLEMKIYDNKEWDL